MGLRIYTPQAAARLLATSVRTLQRARVRAEEHLGTPIGQHVGKQFVYLDDDLDAMRPFLYRRRGNPRGRGIGTVYVRDREPAKREVDPEKFIWGSL